MGEDGKTTKYKLRVDHNKGFYILHLASMHHKFHLKLQSQMDSLKSLSADFGILLKNENNPGDSKSKKRQQKNTTQGKKSALAESFDKESNMFERLKWNTSSSYSVDSCAPRTMELKKNVEECQNKENEQPRCDTITTKQQQRCQVRMGTGMLQAPIQKDPVPSQSAPSSSGQCGSAVNTNCTSSEIYVLNSSIKTIDEDFHIDFQESLSESLMEKFENMPFDEERILSTVRLEKDSNGSLGIQIAQGSDGGVYIHSVMLGGPAYKKKSIYKGDRIIAVNGHSLMNIKYEKALNVLQESGHTVELILSQVYIPCAKDMKDNSPIDCRSTLKEVPVIAPTGFSCLSTYDKVKSKNLNN